MSFLAIRCGIRGLTECVVDGTNTPGDVQHNRHSNCTWIVMGIDWVRKCLAKKMCTHQDVAELRIWSLSTYPTKPVTNRRHTVWHLLLVPYPDCGRLAPSSPHMLPKKYIKLILPNETVLHGLSISYNHNEGCIMVRVVGFRIITDLLIWRRFRFWSLSWMMANPQCLMSATAKTSSRRKTHRWVAHFHDMIISQSQPCIYSHNHTIGLKTILLTSFLWSGLGGMW